MPTSANPPRKVHSGNDGWGRSTGRGERLADRPTRSSPDGGLAADGSRRCLGVRGTRQSTTVPMPDPDVGDAGWGGTILWRCGAWGGGGGEEHVDWVAAGGTG